MPFNGNESKSNSDVSNNASKSTLTSKSALHFDHCPKEIDDIKASHSMVEDGSNYSHDLESEEFDEDVQFYFDRLQHGHGSQNKTFSGDRLREIERKNAILIDKILANSRRPSQYRSTPVPSTKVSSAEINRRKQQAKIDRDNMVSNIFLIESVKSY